MSKLPFSPYKNESESLEIAGLTVENRLDRVSIYGSIDLTKDKEGLEHAREMKKSLDLTVEELEHSNLPNRIQVVKTEIVANPFD